MSQNYKTNVIISEVNTEGILQVQSHCFITNFEQSPYFFSHSCLVGKLAKIGNILDLFFEKNM